jgi:hypothetical protein
MRVVSFSRYASLYLARSKSSVEVLLTSVRARDFSSAEISGRGNESLKAAGLPIACEHSRVGYGLNMEWSLSVNVLTTTPPLLELVTW